MALSSKPFSNLITFTRASNATYFDSVGLLRTAATNAARIDYNPSTLAVRGMLVEEQRTNLFLYSESLDIQHGSWTKGVNTTRIDTEYILGRPATIYQGDGSGANEFIRQSISVTSGVTYTVSVFARLVSGTKPTSGNLITIETTPGSSSPRVALSYSSISLSNTAARYSVSFTAAGTGTISIYFAADQNNTAQISLMGAQVEAGAFATSYIPSSVTFSGRTSSGTYFDSTGTLQTAGSGVSRTTYNPSNLTAEPFLLLEESRTNSIRNSSGTGAVAGTPGTSPTYWSTGVNTSNLNTSIVGTGVEKGIPYIDVRFYGIAATTSEFFVNPEVSVAASSGQTWTGSFYVRMIAGSNANITDVNVIVRGISDPFSVLQVNAGTNFQSSLIASSIAVNRYSTTLSLTNASTAYVNMYLRLSHNAGAAIDITLRCGMPQLEQGAFPTSVISTSSAAVTRAADTSTSATATRAGDDAIVNINGWFYDTEGTVYVEAAIEGVGSSTFPWSVAIDNGTGSNRYGFYLNDPAGDTYNKKMLTGAVGQIDEIGPITLVPNTFIKSAMAVKYNDFAAAYNGGNLQTDTSVNIPTNLTRLLIGSGDNTWSGWIKSVKYYPRRLTDAELQALTT